MVDLLLKRYLWLIDTLRGHQLKYEELANAWEFSSFNDDGSTLAKRTLSNHCRAILRQFGIDIKCRRGRGLNYYYISNPEDLENNSLNKWLLENFSINSILAANEEIADKIILEDVPSAATYLGTILKALKESRTITMSYRNFFGRGFNQQSFSPLCVRISKRRWYVLAQSPDFEYPRIYALDRITDMRINDETFVYPSDFDAKEFFAPYFGTSIDSSVSVEKIKVRAYFELPGYLNSLPMHHSQRLIEKTDDHTDYELTVAPTFDFIQEILLHREQLEVLEPVSLREQIKSIINKMHNFYD